MKNTLLFVLIASVFLSCHQRKQTIEFVPLAATEINSQLWQILPKNMADSAKQAHDSCMGFSFDANALLVQFKDSIFLASIINKQSLKTVGSIHDLGLTEAQMIGQFNMLTNPCYEKRVLHTPMRLLLGENFKLELPNAGNTVNKEINDVIAASKEAEMQSGSWVYLDMKDALKKIVDTSESETVIRYRENLLDSSNMVLTAMESVTDVSFIVDKGSPLSDSLQNILKTKPTIPGTIARTSLRLYYIDDTKFEISINGLFPVIGQFTKAVLK